MAKIRDYTMGGTTYTFLGDGAVQYDAAQTLSDAQKTQALSNISAESVADATAIKSAMNVIDMASGYINTNTNPVNTTVHPSSYGYRYAIIDCTANDVFAISGTGGNGSRLWCFTDSNWNVKRVSAANLTVSNLRLTVPSGATKLIVNIQGDGKVLKANLFDHQTEMRFDAEEEYILGGDVDVSWIEGYYINTSGVETASANGYHHTDFIKVNRQNPWYTIGYSHIGSTTNTTVRVYSYNSSKQWLREAGNFTATPTTERAFYNLTFKEDEAYFIISGSSALADVFSVENTFLDLKDLNVMEAANVNDMMDTFAKPIMTTVCDLQDTSGDATPLTAKASVFKNGDYYCCTFQQNLDGTAIDVPSTSGTGVIAMRYKYFQLVDGEETNVTYGTIAQKGSTYTDYQGNSATFEGGVGKPGGNNGMMFCTAAATGTHTYNGTVGYGMTPCAFSVSVDSTGVTFGDIKELTLSVDGTVGKFDVSRLSDEYVNYYVYYTTTAPAYDGTNWHWLIPVVKGIAYFTSSDGYAWTYVNTVRTYYQTVAEVACENIDTNRLLFSARVGDMHAANPVHGNCAVVGVLNKKGYIEKSYRLPAFTSRQFIAKLNDGQFLLFYNPQSTKEVACLMLSCDAYSKLTFYKWFTITGRATWYASCYKDGLTAAFTDLIIVGTDGGVTSTRKSTFMVLNVPSTPRAMDSLPFEINCNNVHIQKITGANIDANDLAPGTYEWDSGTAPTNLPVAVGSSSAYYGILHVYTAGSLTFQSYQDYSNNFFLRRKTAGGVWSSWSQYLPDAVMFDKTQGLTAKQKATAQANIDIGGTGALAAYGALLNYNYDTPLSAPGGGTGADAMAYERVGTMVKLNGTVTSAWRVRLSGTEDCHLIGTPTTAQTSAGYFTVIPGRIYRARVKLISGSHTTNQTYAVAPIAYEAEARTILNNYKAVNGDTTSLPFVGPSSGKVSLWLYTAPSYTATNATYEMVVEDITSTLSNTATIRLGGAAITLTASSNVRYVYGSLSSLNLTPCADGSCEVVFASGSTATSLTVPNTIKWPEWFDPTSLEKNRVYDIIITDATYGVVTSWAI